MQLDWIDEQIIDILKKDARTSFVEISERLGVSEGCIRQRVKKLVEKGIIKKFTIIVNDPRKIKAIVMVSTEAGSETEKIRKIIEKFPNVEWCCEVSGEYDIILMLSAKNIKELNEAVEKIRKINGVKTTYTNFVMNE